MKREFYTRLREATPAVLDTMFEVLQQEEEAHYRDITREILVDKHRHFYAAPLPAPRIIE